MDASLYIADGCEECLATIDYFPVRGVRKKNILVVNVDDVNNISVNSRTISHRKNEVEAEQICNAGQIWFNNDFIGWLKDVHAMEGEVDKALSRCLITPFTPKMHSHRSGTTADKKKRKKK